jgi:2'-5' RNA ligase
VGLAPFHVQLGGAGCFPNERRPRVLWLGARAGDAELRLLARSLDVALEREGFGRPDRPFEPHMTLGRVRDEADGAAVGARFKAAAFPEAGFDVADLVLVKSTLDPRGSIYEPLVTARLTPRSGEGGGTLGEPGDPAGGPAGNSVPAGG